MSLTVTLPNEIEEQVHNIAVREGREVESVVISAVAHYVAQASRDDEERESRPSASQAMDRSRELYRGFKTRLRQRYSFLGDLSQAQTVELMDQLSEKIAAGMDFETWQEAEAFMRGEVALGGFCTGR